MHDNFVLFGSEFETAPKICIDENSQVYQDIVGAEVKRVPKYDGRQGTIDEYLAYQNCKKTPKS
uniref:Uncharacterized protein n=1 Tax=Romanomermis culicivorax TaxID=13658 RepID=A0A915JSX6_ROMCU